VWGKVELRGDVTCAPPSLITPAQRWAVFIPPTFHIPFPHTVTCSLPGVVTSHLSGSLTYRGGGRGLVWGRHAFLQQNLPWALNTWQDARLAERT
jgi:hypothetical protein